ncbi:MAG: TonB-dependent receptor [Bryobacterales bacterium]|nr:TonB-dependent receptor [Bryobacterales bacterium]
MTALPRLIVAVLALLFVLPAYSQLGGGSVIGFVTDPAGAMVSGVRIAAVNLGTNVRSATVTNDQGYYEFPLLTAGRYKLEAEHPGFQKATSTEFAVNTGTRPRIDLKMVLGQVTESVEVVASAPLVNATTTDLGFVMDRAKVDQLPLNGRDFQQLVGLQAGVITNPSSSAGGRGGIEFHGSASLGNNLLLDGVDMTFGEVNGTASDEAAGAGSAGSLINTISVEAVEEFKASGSAFSAEYGRSGGGVLNITTKGGTNQFHGALFEFFRNDKLDANSFFSNASGLAKPSLRWNQYGGNLGGPIRKDKLFFFFNYEGATVRRPVQITGNVPTPALLSQLKPALRAHYDAMSPKDFTPTANALIGFHRRNDTRRNDENTYLARGDSDFGKHRLSTRFSYNNQDYIDPNLYPTLPRVFPTRFHNAVIQDAWTISPTVFNELRVGLNRVDLFRREIGREKFPAWVTVTSTGPNANLASYIHFITTTYTLADNFTIIKSAHTLKMGFEIREVRSVRDQNGDPGSEYNNLNDLIADRPFRINLTFGGGKGLRSRNYGYYFQDDWKLNRRLQLNMGVRYEYYPPFRGAFNINSSDPFGPFIKAQEPMFAADRNNWAPRLGLVWDTTGDQKMVVRAGFGVGYIPPQAIYFYDAAFVDPQLPFVANFNIADLPPGFDVSFPFSKAFVNQVTANPSLLPRGLILSRQVADYNSRDTYAAQWNLSVQRALTSKLALQTAYVGSRTVKQIAPSTFNLTDPALGRRPRTDIGDVQFFANAANVSYHALQISLNQKLTKGIAFDSYYTWSKSMAYGPADATITFGESTMQDPYNWRDSYGPKQGDLRHRWVNTYSIALPSTRLESSGIGKAIFGGWTLQGIMNWRSGLPVNVTSGVATYPNGRINGQRPDLVSGVDPYIKDSNGLVWLNRAAFDVNVPRTQRRYGNLGYNVFRGPSGFGYDAALHKRFAVTEGHNITFRFEMFNALNHKVLSGPNSNLASPQFGLITGASGGRNIQLALKYTF